MSKARLLVNCTNEHMTVFLWRSPVLLEGSCNSSPPAIDPGKVSEQCLLPYSPFRIVQTLIAGDLYVPCFNDTFYYDNGYDIGRFNTKNQVIANDSLNGELKYQLLSFIRKLFPDELVGYK